MDIEIIRRICLARHLFELGISGLKSSNDLFLFSAVNLLQDAVEAFLLAVADFFHAGIDQNTKFDKYFILINEKILPKELPFKSKLMRLNRIRVDSKHYGIQPERNECERLSVPVREFFDEVSSSILWVNFATVSTIDLLKDGEVKNLLNEAKLALEDGDFETCAISCRKAIYIEIEKDYDISMFRAGAKPRGFLGPYSHAPFYARNKEYIEENVKDPIGYIVYDYSSLDQELLKYAVDNTSFWNLYRLTPEVFRNEDNQWIVKYDFDKLEKELLKDKIEYIFSTTVDIIFSIHSKKEAVKTSDYRKYYLELNQEEVPIYEKADVNSKIIGNTPPGVARLDCDYYVTGLQNDGIYWKVHYYNQDIYLVGYIHNNYVKNT